MGTFLLSYKLPCLLYFYGKIMSYCSAKKVTNVKILITMCVFNYL